MRTLFIAALLVLHCSLGNAEIKEEEEEIPKFLHEFASYYSDDLYQTVEYYYDNITVTPIMYFYEDVQESVGSPLQCHLSLVVLLSLLALLL